MANSARERSTCAAGALSERLRRVSSWGSSAASGRRGSFRWRDRGHLGARGSPHHHTTSHGNRPTSRTAHLVRCSTPPSFGPTSWRLGQWAARPGAGPLARGLSTKIHLKVDLDGRPFAFHLTAGQASDSPQFEILLDLGPDIMPRAVVGDKGYDSTGNRTAARERGICPVIPFKSSARNRPAFFPKALYRARARIEQLVGKL